MTSFIDRRFRLLALALLLVQVLVLYVRHSDAGFGFAHDDGLYFSSAKALAEGKGYVVPSLPGEPAQTKYPPLYSALLSLIWYASPEFPANLALAFWLNALLALGSTGAAIVVTRQLGASRPLALGIATIFALHPYTIFWANLVLSDILFAALTLGACARAGRALERSHNSFPKWWAAATALAWLAVLTRSLGIALVAGLAASAIWNRRFVAALVAMTASFPVAYSLISKVGGLDVSAGSGYAQNLAYYTSYLRFWQLSVPSLDAFAAQAGVMLGELLKHPAIACFMLPATGSASSWLQAATITVTAGIVKGAVTSAKTHGWRPIHFTFLFYLPVILIWNYALMSRFLLPFVPLFLLGAAVEFGGLWKTIVQTVRSDKPLVDRAVASAMAVVLIGLVGHAGQRYIWSVPQGLQRMLERRAEIADAKQAAYVWLRENAAANDRVISYEDPSLYLHSGLQGMRPMSFSTEAFFRKDEAILDRDLARLNETPKEIGAKYWVVSVDDFANETAEQEVREAVSELVEQWPAVFTSDDAKVRIHAIREMSASYWRPSPYLRY